MTGESTGTSGHVPEVPGKPRRMPLVLVVLAYWAAFGWLSIDDAPLDARWIWMRLARVVVLALSAVLAFGREPGGYQRSARGVGGARCARA